jgi:hypothetical protein
MFMFFLFFFLLLFLADSPRDGIAVRAFGSGDKSRRRAFLAAIGRCQRRRAKP